MSTVLAAPPQSSDLSGLNDKQLESIFKILKARAERLCGGRIDGATLAAKDAMTAGALLAASLEILSRP